MIQKLSPEQKLIRLKTSTLKPEDRARNEAICLLYFVENIKTKTLPLLSVLDFDLFEGELRLSSKARFQKLNKKTIESIKAHLKKRSESPAKTDFLFVDKQGEQISEKTIRSILKAIRMATQ